MMAKFNTFCQMPLPYDQARLPKDFAVEEKVAGIRSIFVFGKFRTWDDKTLPVAKAIVDAAEAVRAQFGPPTLLDGVFQPTSVGADLDHPEQKERVFGIFHIFDAVRGTSLADRSRSDGYVRRKRDLKSVMLQRDLSKPGLALIDAVPLRDEGSPEERIIASAEVIWAKGGLGVIVKNREAFYQHGCSDAWLRLTREDIAAPQTVAA